MRSQNPSLNFMLRMGTRIAEGLVLSLNTISTRKLTSSEIMPTYSMRRAVREQGPYVYNMDPKTHADCLGAFASRSSSSKLVYPKYDTMHGKTSTICIHDIVGRSDLKSVMLGYWPCVAQIEIVGNTVLPVHKCSVTLANLG